MLSFFCTDFCNACETFVIRKERESIARSDKKL